MALQEDVRESLEALEVCAADPLLLDTLPAPVASELCEVLAAARLLSPSMLASAGSKPMQSRPQDRRKLADVACVCFKIVVELGLTDSIIPIIREGLVVLSSLLPLVDYAAPTLAEDVWNVLEELSDDLDCMVMQLCRQLSRAEQVTAVGSATVNCSHGGVFGPARSRLEYLHNIAVWATIILVRSVGLHRFCGQHLWEWTSNDHCCTCLLAKIMLWADPCSSLKVPTDMSQMQEAVLSAVLELASPDIVFSPSESCMDQGSVDISARAEALSLHRMLLAAAVADTGLVDILIACLRKSSKSEYLKREEPTALAIVAFFAALLQPPAETLPGALQGYRDALQAQLVCHSEELWLLLGNTSNSIPPSLSGYKQFVRVLLQNCAQLAYTIPLDHIGCSVFLRRCLSDQTSKIAEITCRDSRALAALMVLAANSGFTPRSDHLSGSLSLAAPETKAKIAGCLTRWNYCCQREALVPWLEVLNAATQSLSDEEEDDFFELSRQSIKMGGMKPPVMSQLPHVVTASRPAVPTQGEASGLRELILNVPPEFCCAIDGKLLVDPVQSPHGHVFERSVLEAALAIHPFCPMSKQPLLLVDCCRVPDLRHQILSWVRQTKPKKPPAARS